MESIATSKPSTAEALISSLGRLYPFASGCGTITNLSAFKALADWRRADVLADVAGYKALVPLDDLVGRAMYFFGDLDPKVTWAFRKYVRPGDVVFDIGANLGLATLYLARLVGPSGTVHAFEPNPRMLAYLNATLDSNPDLDISIHSVALGERKDTLELIIPEKNQGAASLLDIGGRQERDRLCVDVLTMSDFCEQNGVDRVDFMKIDVEGFEEQVLRGAEDLFLTSPPRAIVFEQNGFQVGKRPDAFRFLESTGYKIFALPKKILRPKITSIDDPQARTAHDFVALYKP